MSLCPVASSEMEKLEVSYCSVTYSFLAQLYSLFLYYPSIIANKMGGGAPPFFWETPPKKARDL